MNQLDMENFAETFADLGQLMLMVHILHFIDVTNLIKILSVETNVATENVIKNAFTDTALQELLHVARAVNAAKIAALNLHL